MSSFVKRCEKYFNTGDYYEILRINRNATNAEIKKAYHRLSLLVHPDRVDEGKKLEATEKFKVLSRIHATLQDPEKRKVYDSCGDYDEESDDNASTFNWMDYWNSIFKEIKLEDIENYKKEYIGSETEINDIKKAYVGTKGKMNKILEMVPFSDCENEERIIAIVRKMVDNGEVEEFKCFFNEPRREKEKRRRKLEKEKKVAEQMAVDAEALQKEMEERKKNRQSEFANLMASIEAKYAKKPVKRQSITGAESPRPVKRSSRRNKN